MSEPEERASRADYVAFEPVALRWNDIDRYGHLYNTAYLELMDNAMTQWLIGAGLMDREGRPLLVVIENGCRYFEELHYGEAVTVGLRLGWLRRRAFRLDMAIFAGERARAAAQGFFCMVRLNPQTRRPEEIPKPDRARFAALAPPGFDALVSPA